MSHEQLFPAYQCSLTFQLKCVVFQLKCVLLSTGHFETSKDSEIERNLRLTKSSKIFFCNKIVKIDRLLCSLPWQRLCITHNLRLGWPGISFDSDCNPRDSTRKSMIIGAARGLNVGHSCGRVPPIFLARIWFFFQKFKHELIFPSLVQDSGFLVYSCFVKQGVAGCEVLA